MEGEGEGLNEEKGVNGREMRGRWQNGEKGSVGVGVKVGKEEGGWKEEKGQGGVKGRGREGGEMTGEGARGD